MHNGHSNIWCDVVGDQFARAWGSRAHKVDNSTAAASNSTASTSTQTAAASNGTAASSTQTAAAATRTRPCDQGDQSLAAALNSMVTVGLVRLVLFFSLSQ